jgi:hypothetical protein
MGRTPSTYRKLDDLNEEETNAARAYGAESGFFHLALQADFSLVLGEFHAFGDFQQSGKLQNLLSATKKYALTTSLTLYSGHGNGAGIVGALGHTEAERFIGTVWQYRGFTSTSSIQHIAEEFLWKRARHQNDTPVLLEFRLPVGFRLLPMAVLGPDMTNENEFLLPPKVRYSIVGASRRSIDSILVGRNTNPAKANEFLHLVLSNPSAQ